MPLDYRLIIFALALGVLGYPFASQAQAPESAGAPTQTPGEPIEFIQIPPEAQPSAPQASDAGMPAPPEDDIFFDQAADADSRQNDQDDEEDDIPPVFFDSSGGEASGTSQSRSQRDGLRKVDPRQEPASRFVVVREVKSADALQSQIVSAVRAFKLGRFDAALEMYETLYKKNKKNPQVLIGYANTLKELNRFEEAMKVYQDLQDLRPDNVEAQINMLGLLSEKFPAVALQRLKNLRSDTPNSVGIVAQLAITFARTGNVTEALRYINVAASMQPNNPLHIFNKAVILDRAGQHKDSVTYYEQALQKDTLNGASDSVPRGQIYERLAELRRL